MCQHRLFPAHQSASSHPCHAPRLEPWVPWTLSSAHSLGRLTFLKAKSVRHVRSTYLSGAQALACGSGLNPVEDAIMLCHLGAPAAHIMHRAELSSHICGLATPSNSLSPLTYHINSSNNPSLPWQPQQHPPTSTPLSTPPCGRFVSSLPKNQTTTGYS